MRNYDRYPVYSARCEGRDIVRAGLAPYMESVGLKMPPAVPVNIPNAEAAAVWEDSSAAVKRAFNGVRFAFQNMAQNMAQSAQAAARTLERGWRAMPQDVRDQITRETLGQ